MNFRVPIDPSTAERLLSGCTPPDDVPSELAPLAATLQTAASPAPPGSPAPAFVSSLVAAIGDGSRLTPRRDAMVVKRLSVKAVAVAAILLLGAGAAAAATGSTLGAHKSEPAVSTPGADLPTTTVGTTSTTESDTTPPQDQTGPADNHGADVSAVARSTDTSGADHGAAVCDVASEGRCTDHRGGPEANPGGASGDDDQANDGDDDQANDGDGDQGADAGGTHAPSHGHGHTKR
jgi:hypothetical protein